MPIRLRPTLREALAGAERPLAGMWVSSGSAVVAEICAGSGLDWILIDMEHGPNGLESVLAQLHAVAAYDIIPAVRVPSADATVLKQVLDIGAQTVIVPMISSAAEAAAAVTAVRYQPRGIRGVGSALARSGRWNRVDDYLAHADAHVSLFVQIESSAGVEAAGEIAAVDGVDGVFIGPSDLAASMGLLGEQTHPDVVAAVLHTFEAVRAAGMPVGVNAFDPGVVQSYLDAGARFVVVSADVTLLARGSEALAARWSGA